MRNDLPNITESADELRLKIDATTRKRMKQRLEALFLIQSGECGTRDTVAATLGVHRHTISRWLTKYEEGGIDELLEIRTRPNRKRVVPERVFRQLETALRTSPEQFSSYRDVQTWLRSQFNLNVKYKTLYRLIRYELGIDLAGNNEEQATPQLAIQVVPIRKTEVDVLNDQEPRNPTVANFFRSVASMLEDATVESEDLIDAVNAARAILNAAPPFGTFADRAETHLPDVGRQIRKDRRDASRELDLNRLSAENKRSTVAQTRSLLYRLADEMDSVDNGEREPGKRNTFMPPREEDMPYHIVDEPSALFFNDEDDYDSADLFQDDLANEHIVTDAEPVIVSEDSKTEHRLPGRIAGDKDDFTGRLDSESGAGKRAPEYLVLFAEDDDITASIVTRQLGKQSAGLLRATSAKMAFTLLAKYPVDLIVVSTKLGNESGLTLLSELRNEPAFDQIPIVVVGWPEDVQNDAEAKLRGADAYLEKPFSPSEFTSTVMRLLFAARASVQRRPDRLPSEFVSRDTESIRSDASSSS